MARLQRQSAEAAGQAYIIKVGQARVPISLSKNNTVSNMLLTGAIRTAAVAIIFAMGAQAAPTNDQELENTLGLPSEIHKVTYSSSGFGDVAYEGLDARQGPAIKASQPVPGQVRQLRQVDRRQLSQREVNKREGRVAPRAAASDNYGVCSDSPSNPADADLVYAKIPNSGFNANDPYFVSTPLVPCMSCTVDIPHPSGNVPG